MVVKGLETLNPKHFFPPRFPHYLFNSYARRKTSKARHIGNTTQTNKNVRSNYCPTNCLRRQGYYHEVSAKGSFDRNSRRSRCRFRKRARVFFFSKSAVSSGFVRSCVRCNLYLAIGKVFVLRDFAAMFTTGR
jgi:hypothetical protein